MSQPQPPLNETPELVLNLDEELLTLCLTESLQLCGQLQQHQSLEVRRLAAQLRLRVAYHLLHSSRTSQDSALRSLALEHSRLAETFLHSRQARWQTLQSQSP